MLRRSDLEYAIRDTIMQAFVTLCEQLWCHSFGSTNPFLEWWAGGTDADSACGGWGS